MQRCFPILFIGNWSSGLDIRTDAVTQVILKRGQNVRNVKNDSERSSYSQPLRCVIARRNICRGERICLVPESHILHGENASHLLQSVSSAGRGVEMNNFSITNFSDLQRRLGDIRGDPFFLSTRDALLITLALYVLRQYSNGIHHSLTSWAASLPPRIPPMGLLLMKNIGPAPFEPLQRRLRIGNHTLALESPNNSDNNNNYNNNNNNILSTELVLQAAETYGIENVGKPQKEIVTSPALLRAFHRGTRHPLTQRQHESFTAKQRHSESAAVREFIQLEESLYNNVLMPLVPCVLPAYKDNGSTHNNNNNNNNNNNEKEGEKNDDVVISNTINKLRWSHFMMRSRAINLNSNELEQNPKVAIVPFLDMLNHNAREPNITYQYRQGTGVIIVAKRLIKASEELTLNYGSYRHRGCLFAPISEQKPYVGGGSSSFFVAQRMDSYQIREWNNSVDEDEDILEEAPFGHGLQQPQNPQLTKTGNTTTTSSTNSTNKEEEDNNNLESRTETIWLWRFGFPRDDDEKSYVASRLWSKGLRRRISQLTDIRRRGRSGEFVIGVPEGLQYLREQRERIERERFSGTTVFPPQKV